MASPSISVIVPMYKVEQYIKICVDSILSQTFQDFEIILIDDASPDNCVEICQKLYGDNEKVRLVRHEKNLGLGAARNTGMKHARGKYIYFVDSDDLILPNALEKFFTVAEKTNAQVVHAAGRLELTQDEPLPIRQENLKLTWDKYAVEGFLPNNLIYRLEEHWRKYGTRSTAWVCFCRRDLIEQNRIEFLDVISEDELFSFALFCLAERYYILHEALYIYRRRSGSIMTTKDAKNFSQRIEGMVTGSIYIKNFLDRLPHFDNREAWCEKFLSEFIDRLIRNRTTPHYENLTVSNEIDTAAVDTLKKFFTDGAGFVKFFFHGFHIFRRQAEILLQQRDQLIGQNLMLQQRNQQSNNLLSIFLREQDKLLKIIDRLKHADERILLIGTPEHGNLGDHAIVSGEWHVLKKFFPEREIIEIPFACLTGELGELLFGLGLQKYVRRTDIIFLVGGGNLGNLWINEENFRRSLIEKFSKNKIVIFPQSIYFTDDDAGRNELARSQKIYNAHKDLHLMTRDENSFSLAKKFFSSAKNYLLPDTATVLQGIVDDVDVAREGVLFVLRRDKEKIRDDATITQIQDYLTAKNIPFEVTDTVIGNKVTAQNREQKILDVLTKFRRSKLVITDRFHGVIFSFVTRTPVLAFKSFDTKISSGIKWFRNLPTIFYAEDRDWSTIQNFLDANYFAEEKFSDALNVTVATDAEKRFFNVLNKIIRRENVEIQSSPPPVCREIGTERIKKVFTLHPPLSICNFRCHYCYLAQRAEAYQGIQPEMKYSPEHVARALSTKRLGGQAYFNICASGETLLLKDLDVYVKHLVEQEHYAEIVTNCTINPMLEKFLSWDKELLAQIEFKCSFHYLELKKRNLLDRFAANVNKIWDAGASACVEITPSDELIPYIDEVKTFSLKNFGALPLITIARDDRTRGIDILSNLSKDEYYKTWGQFDSAFFDYKASIFGKRQEEFCYAGIWSAWIDLATGHAKACYCGKNLGDVFANPDSDFPTWPVGKCTIAHCYNGHAWLTWGNIPHSTEITYAEMRNRIRDDGREWLHPKLKKFFGTHLCDNNAELSDADKLHFMILNRLDIS